MFDIIIIGGGIVGLSSMYQLFKTYPSKKVLIIEKEKTVGMHQTGHNSGVIHSGLYYKPGSIKAQNCRKGIEELKSFCTDFGINYEICGKLVIAKNKDQIPQLHNLFKRGKENGIKNLKIIDKENIQYYEPYAIGEAALLCPETGIVDYSKVANILFEQIQNKGEVLMGQKVINIIKNKNNIVIKTDKKEFQTKCVINCAGLFSDKIASLSGLKRDYRIIPFRGEYYSLRKESTYLVNNLIYPVPDPRYPFLGVHFTRRIDSSIEAGPNAVLAWAREGYDKYDFNLKEVLDFLLYKGFWKMSMRHWRTGLSEYYRSFSKKSFLKSLQQIIPEINENDLVKSPSGVRAQALSLSGSLVDDFVIRRDENIINIVNAPSPAATSCLSIGNYIKELYAETLK